MKDIIYTTPATLTSIRSRVDKSYSLNFNTQELSATDVAALSSMLQVSGTLAVVANEAAQEEDFKDIEAPELVLEDKEKSPSERLRSVLFVMYKEKRTNEPFDIWYRKYMEMIINQIKAKLPAQ